MDDEDQSISGTDNRPVLHIIAGANGSGKSTFTKSDSFEKVIIIDPDEIARGISHKNPENVAIAAGREASVRRRKILAAGENLVVETTLAGNSILKLMNEARLLGYDVNLHYISVGDPLLAIDRVLDRITKGGHGVPEEDIRRRFKRSHENLPKAIVLSNCTKLYDNRNSGNPYSMVANLIYDKYWFSEDTPDWARDAFERAKNFYSDVIRNDALEF